MINENYKDSELTGKIIGCAMEVHKTIGNGFQEIIYQRSLSIELDQQGINHVQELSMPIYYKHHRVGTRRVDFLIEDRICLEIKAVIQLDNAHLAQAINYLEAYNLETGLFINFGSTSLKFKRLRNKKYRP